MGNLMFPTITREHGQMELLAYKEAGTVRLFLETLSRKGERQPMPGPDSPGPGVCLH